MTVTVTMTMTMTMTVPVTADVVQKHSTAIIDEVSSREEPGWVQRGYGEVD